MKAISIVTTALTALLAAAPASAQGSKVAVGISGWSGFAPLVFAKESGIFSSNGVDDLDRVERQWRSHHSTLPDGQVVRR